MEETSYPFFQYIYAKLNEKFNYTEYRSFENKNWKTSLMLEIMNNLFSVLFFKNIVFILFFIISTIFSISPSISKLTVARILFIVYLCIIIIKYIKNSCSPIVYNFLL